MEKENKTLKERMIELRSSTDVTLPTKKYVMVMIDGRSFSHIVKNKYEKPFDDRFIEIMNEVAIYVCKNVQCCKLAYAQSDEITFVLTDFENENACAFFGNRLTKILSIIPSMATAKYNQLVIADRIAFGWQNSQSIKNTILDTKLAEFDCKAWSVDNLNDVYSYYLWRQLDCIRNSKQQTAQTWLSHNTLKGLNCDEQIELLHNKKDIDWNEFEDYKKYGRFIYKEKEMFHNEELGTDYERSIWKVHDAFPINGDGKDKFLNLGIIPDISLTKNKIEDK